MNPAQKRVLEDLQDSYGEGEVVDGDSGGDVIFRAGEQELLISEDGAIVEPHESSGGSGGAAPESATPTADQQQGDPDACAHTGTGSPAVSFPVDSFREAAIHLRRPFTAEAVKWKVQATWEGGALIVPYIDARLVVERLNLVVPHLWYDDYESVAGGKGLLCRLTIDGITRQDVGGGYQGKGLYSDALKRAAVKFGIGVSLYALPQIKFDFSEGFLAKQGSKQATVLTDKGLARCQSGYRAWLKEAAGKNFGDPLDHGDIGESYGDVEAEQPVEGPPEEPRPEKLTTAAGTALIEKAEQLHKTVDKKAMPPAAFRRQLEGAWHSEEELKKLIGVLEGLQPAGAKS